MGKTALCYRNWRRRWSIFLFFLRLVAGLFSFTQAMADWLNGCQGGAQDLAPFRFFKRSTWRRVRQKGPDLL